MCLMTQLGAGKINLNLVLSPSKMHQNQVGQNLHLVKKSFKIKEIIEGDARFTVRDIARTVGISLSMVHLILKKHLKVRKTFARWVPHLLTDEKTDNGIKWPKICFKCFKLVTKSSLPMSSLVMKIGSIILSPSESLTIKSGPLNIADAQ